MKDLIINIFGVCIMCTVYCFALAILKINNVNETVSLLLAFSIALILGSLLIWLFHYLLYLPSHIAHKKRIRMWCQMIEDNINERV